MIIKNDDAVKYSREGLNARYYQFPDINGGTTIAVAKFTGEHGERTIGDHSRIYFILEGSAKVVICGKEFIAEKGDTIAIPANGTYNLWPVGESVEVLLAMDLLDLDKLPK